MLLDQAATVGGFNEFPKADFRRAAHETGQTFALSVRRSAFEFAGRFAAARR
jgi:hypothetical protein